MIPVMSPQPGTVDVLVVTRDLWSLRFNTNFEFQENTLSLLQTSLSENNLLGWRKYLAFNFNMDLGAFAIGPTYFDPNIHGTRLTLLASASALYGRESRSYEGNTETASLHYPLYALASRWGGGVDVVHQDAIIRYFQGTAVRQVQVPGAPDGTPPVDYDYRRKIFAIDSFVVRQLRSENWIQRITFGHHYDARSSAVLPDFNGDAATAQLFLASDLVPRTETRSELYLQYDVFTPRYLVIRDLDTFDLRENRRLGPSVTLRAGLGLRELGSDYQYVPLSAAIGWAEAPGGGFGSVGLAGGARLISGTLFDQFVTAKAFVASPILGRTGRVVAAGQLDAVRNDTLGTQFVLGGDTGMRGYAIGDFVGQARAVGHVELRTLPLAIWSQRVGALAFYDVGDAAPTVSQLFAYHDLGLGVRWLIPQLNPTVIRFDWAVAMQSTTPIGGLTRAGFPGRFSAGFMQVF